MSALCVVALNPSIQILLNFFHAQINLFPEGDGIRGFNQDNEDIPMTCLDGFGPGTCKFPEMKPR